MQRVRLPVVGGLVKVLSNPTANSADSIANLQAAVNALNLAVLRLQAPPSTPTTPITGAQGQSIRGRQGEDGEAGRRGPIGPVGNPGPQGASIRGRQGDEGDRGAAGVPGLPGAKGSPGSAGATGQQGPPGRRGEDGEVGRIGVPGTPGAAGAAGSPGAQGLPGVAVVREGVEGEPGRRGVPGPIGPQGIQGLPGVAVVREGLEGEQGRRGIPGPVGPASTVPGPVGVPARRTYHDDPIERAPRGSLFNDCANHTEYGLWTFSPPSGLPITSKSSGELLRMTTTTARGSGAGYMAFNDPTGQKGYFGYGGVNDTFYCFNSMNSGLVFATNGVLAFSISNVGAMTLAAPSSGTAFTVNGNTATGPMVVNCNADDWAIKINANTASGLSLGPLITAGTTAADWGMILQNVAGTLNLLAVKGNGAVQMQLYGAGAATFDASGNITSVSDERAKRDIRPFTRGLSDVLKLKPILHGYTLESGLDQTKDDYAGFSAQNVQSVMPEAVGQMTDGMLTLNDRAILAAVVNAIRELEQRI